MEFLKNDDLLNNICLVQIKSADHVVDISDFIDLYSTPSKITCTNTSKLDAAGALHTKNLQLSYPGLSATDFNKFDALIKGNYQVLIKLYNNDIYELASLQIPMACSTSYSAGSGHALNFSVTSPMTIKYRDNQAGDGISVDGFNYDFNFNL